MQHIVIIGNGIAGITAARHIRKLSDAKITVISGETEHFYARTALMYVFMGRMKFEHTKPYEDWFWSKNRIDLRQDWVKTIDFQKKTLYLENSATIKYDKLIIATGSKPTKLGCIGEDLQGVQGFYSFQDWENLEKNVQKVERAVIIGGGLIGVELAEMLLSRGIKVTFLVREEGFWISVMPKEESRLINNHLQAHTIDLRLKEELQEIRGNAEGSVKSIQTKSGEVIDCQLVLISIGVQPNVDFLKNTDLAIHRGVLVNEYFQTNIPEVYAIGDCAEHQNPLNGRKSVESLWYTGRMMGETLAQTLCGQPKKYSPSFFFNSAKFFEIEYQTYGNVPAILPPNMESFYWEHPNEKISLRINFDTEKQEIKGVNVLGIRMRHEVWNQWLKEKQTIDFVIENLEKVNFDPEFYKKYKSTIIEKYNFVFSKNIQIKTTVGFWRLF